MTETQTETPAEKPKASSKTAWKKAGTHEGITLPSGAVVDVRLPNLPELIAAGAVPNELVDAAIEFGTQRKITPEIIAESWEFVKYVVPITVTSPAISADDVSDIPSEDLQMIAGFAARTVDVDAVGHHLGGLETSAAWRRFRGQLDIEEIAASLPSD